MNVSILDRNSKYQKTRFKKTNKRYLEAVSTRARVKVHFLLWFPFEVLELDFIVDRGHGMAMVNFKTPVDNPAINGNSIH